MALASKKLEVGTSIISKFTLATPLRTKRTLIIKIINSESILYTEYEFTLQIFDKTKFF